jgi:hypothetical protein
MEVYSGPEKAHCVFWYNETKSVTVVECRFCTEYGKEPPARKMVYVWYRLFAERGCLSSQEGKDGGRHVHQQRLANMSVKVFCAACISTHIMQVKSLNFTANSMEDPVMETFFQIATSAGIKQK